MSSTTYPIRVEDDLKRSAAEVAEYYGFDLTSVTRAFWKQMSRTRSIPLSLTFEEPNDESLQAIEETAAIVASGGGRRFKSTGELISALEL